MSIGKRLLEGAAGRAAELAVLGALAVLVAAADVLLPDEVLEGLGQYASGRLVLSLAAVVVFLLVVIVLAQRLRYDERTGTFIGRGATRYCVTCVVDRRRRMPLQRVPSGWWCYRCKQEYLDPDYQAPPAPPARRVRSSWLWGDRPY